ncbi:MAG: hypothetical protein P4L50_05260 [Anaerolineaceae bacterium]|nr:hypothetical protein [Anaerolineaceae bacterium]
MSNTTKVQTLLRGFIVLSVVVLAAFTTNGAWAATYSTGDVSGKKPATNPSSGPLANSQGQLCPNGVSMALEPNCLTDGTSHVSSSLHGSQDKGSSPSSTTRTFNLNTVKNNSNSSSNTNNLPQPWIKIGKAPSVNTTVSTLLSNNKGSNSKGNSNSATNLSKLIVNNSSNSSSNSKDPSKLIVNNSSNSSSTTKDTGKATNTKLPDPPSSNTTSRESKLIQSFEKLTGHSLSASQLKALVSSDSLNSEGETRFLQRLENLTGQDLNHNQLSEVEGTGSQSVNSEGETALVQRFENITGQDLTNAQIADLERGGSLNSEGETQFVQNLENITGHEISNSEVNEVEGNEGEGSESVNSEGESAETQEIENATGQEIGSEESNENEESSTEESEETTDDENAESLSTQIAEGEVVPLTGGVATVPLSTIAGSITSLSEANGVDTFQVGSTTVQANNSIMGNNTLQNGLNIELDGTVASNGVFVSNTLDALTNNADTVIAGTISSFSQTGNVDTFLIGNTNVRMSSTLLGSNTVQNGETIKLNGFYTTDALHYVATAVESIGQ